MQIGRHQASPEFDTPRPLPSSVLRARNFYEGGAQTRRTSKWNAPTVSPNDAVLSNMRTLRDRSRHAVRNDGFAKKVIDSLVTNAIGTGISPLSKAENKEFRQAIQKLWLTWTDESDADGVLDWYGQTTQAVRTWLEAGECFIRIRPRLPKDGLTVPLQIQVLEPELCPHDYDVMGTASGTRIRAGIEFNAIGKRVAYWFYTQRPGDYQDFDAGDLRRIPAEAVIHLYDPLRPGQLRGLPHLTQALLKLYELDKFDDATLMRQQLSNMFVGFLKRPASASDSTINPFSGQELASSETVPEQPMVALQPGMWQELNPGEEVEFSDPPDVGSVYPDFMRQQLYAIAAATSVPYEVLTGDMTRVNDRTVRVILHEFRRRIMTVQHQIVAFQLCRRVWSAWMDAVYFSGALAIPSAYLDDPMPWADVKWMPQGWPYLQPVQDIESQQAAIRAGLTTRSAQVSEQGEDAEQIDEEQAADNARADLFGLLYDSDARKARNTTATATLEDPAAGTGAAA